MQYFAVLLVLMIGGGSESVESGAIDIPCPNSKGCHVVPYLFAETSGGFVGEARSKSNPPRFTLQCGGNGNTGISKILTPDSNGVVIQEFGPLDPHMYCGGNEVKYNRITGLNDGGWFWVSRGHRVAVAPLLARSVLSNRKVRYVDPGYGVTLDRKGYTTLLEEKNTGHLIMMLNVVPQPEPPLPDKCGPIVVEREWRQLFSNCLIGDGGTYIQFSIYGIGSSLTPITEGVVYRPTHGSLAVDLSLWLNESGSINSGYDPTVGWNSVKGAKSLSVTNWSVVVSTYIPGGSLESAGIDVSDLNNGYIFIKPTDEFCSESSSQSVIIEVRAFVDEFENPTISPPFTKSKFDQSVASSNLTIACPGGATQ